MNSKPKSQSKKVNKAWGISVGELVFSPSAFASLQEVRLGKVLNIDDLNYKMVCDVFWFGEGGEYEKNIPLSYVSSVDSLKKFKTKYSSNQAPASKN